MYLTLQRTDFDCFLTSLSMFSGKTYEELVDASPEDAAYIRGNGANIDRISYFGKQWGVKLRKKNGIPKRKSILVIKYASGNRHAVFFDGVRAFDPDPYSYYTTSQLLEMTEFYLY